MLSTLIWLFMHENRVEYPEKHPEFFFILKNNVYCSQACKRRVCSLSVTRCMVLIQN